jgi:hypothetical protein
MVFLTVSEGSSMMMARSMRDVSITESLSVIRLSLFEKMAVSIEATSKITKPTGTENSQRINSSTRGIGSMTSPVERPGRSTVAFPTSRGNFQTE